MTDVIVVGAGVIGVTTGIALLTAGVPVTIWARDFSPHTTSDAAGAIWYPYEVYPLDRALTWAYASYDVLSALAQEENTGVSMVWLRQLFAGDPPPPWLLEATFPVRRMATT